MSRYPFTFSRMALYALLITLASSLSLTSAATISTSTATSASASASTASHPAPTVRTRHQGTFRGLYNATSNVEVFHGIPFAQPPVGELRFAKTKSLDKYTGTKIRDATQVNKGCLQSGPPSYDNVTDEDCLYLQIHRPQGTKEGDDLPVLMWIYGGAWTTGTTQFYGFPNELVNHSVNLGKKVIHVAAEYRLGAFGYLGGSQVLAESKRGGEKAATPNAGYYDQRETMKWLQKNIKSFGGDPSRVTIFGQSAGAQSVSIHLLANGGDNQGLFSGAILQSGAPATAARYNLTAPRPQDAYNQLLNQTNCTDLACLRQFDARKLRDISTAINTATYIYGYPAWTPLIDGYFIPDVPSRVYAKGAIADVPIIVGTAQDEGTLFSDWAANVTTEEDFTRGILIAQDNMTSSLTPTLLNKIWPNEDDVGAPFRPEFFNVSRTDRYFGPQSDFKRASAIFGDWAFHAPVRSLLHATQKLNRKSTWSYLFAQPTADFYNLNESYRGVPHGSDIAYVYHYPAKTDNATATSPAAQKYCNAREVEEVSEFMSAAWINFAHYGNPNGKEDHKNSHKHGGGHTHADSHHWPAYGTQGDGKVLYIQGGNFTTIPGNYRQKEVEFFLRHKDVYVL